MKARFHLTRTKVPKAPLMGASEEQSQDIPYSVFFRATLPKALLMGAFPHFTTALLRLKQRREALPALDALDGIAEHLRDRDDLDLVG